MILHRVKTQGRDVASLSDTVSDPSGSSRPTLSPISPSCQVSGFLGFLVSSQIRTKLRDWAVWQARSGCYSQAALSSNDSKTLYTVQMFSTGNSYYMSHNLFSGATKNIHTQHRSMDDGVLKRKMWINK